MAEWPAVFAVEGVERNYAWGSPTLIPRLLGAEPDGRPIAELWFGAHEDDPSYVVSEGVALDTLIATEPAALLGTAVADRFDGRLPFLTKVLAAERALSIQVHPTLDQARAGFEAENALGLARDAPDRLYRDANHKPELLCALTPFDALCGFRECADTLRLLDALGCAPLIPVRTALAAGDLKDAFTWLLRADDPVPIVRSVVAQAGRLLDDPEWAGAARAVAMANADFPDDIGVALSLLLNDVRLEPGEAIYLGAGNVHCYLRGMGVEVMANSDNVLRCGLTPKHIDLDALLTVADFTPLAQPRFAPDRTDGTGSEFQPPVPDFRVTSVDLDGYRKPGAALGSCAAGTSSQPYLVLCVSGALEIVAAGDRVSLLPGRAAFVPAREAAFTLTGAGQAFLVTVGADRQT
ncbi:MAG TPA: mannose-6-phosphate isomerase, class I [Jatrophihabitantaceae bacterium]|jgi:mannose-6-phosphate isomerase|nr:mannose-6-phosphate isomerase, class I [Jatrophihabitantaceae bacterium]